MAAENEDLSLEEKERSLIERAAQGDRSSFDALVKLVAPTVLTVLYYMTGDREEAEDLAQEVFLKVFRGLADLRGKSSFRSWLYRIVHNVYASRITYLKAQKRQETFSTASDTQLANTPALEKDSPEKKVMDKELNEAIRSAVLGLDPEFRELVVLRDLEDRSYEEISEATGLPLGTVKSRIHRARLMLREKLKRYL